MAVYLYSRQGPNTAKIVDIQRNLTDARAATRLLKELVDNMSDAEITSELGIRASDVTVFKTALASLFTTMTTDAEITAFISQLVLSDSIT